MSKHNYFVAFLKKINLFINSLLKKYLNKLNINNSSNIIQSNKVFLSFVALIILFLSYLSIPHIYNKLEIQKELESQLSDKFSLNFIFSKKISYRFFPRPQFIIEDLIILENQSKISNIKKLSINVSLGNLFSLKKVAINDVIIENANFDINKENSEFFTKLLDHNFIDGSMVIKNSNIFFRNNDQEVLFINKIINMKYHYDVKKLKNIMSSQNEIFNIPYTFKSSKDSVNKKIFSKINFKFLKLQIENELDYSNRLNKGLTNFIYNKNKSKVSYEWNENYFNFNLFDKLINPKFFYEGNIYFNPFYSNFNGNTDNLNLSVLFKDNSFIIDFLKTEILNNKNLNIYLNINAKKIYRFQNIADLILNFKIKEGLIDIDETKFNWNNNARFIISNSLIYVKKNQLILDGKMLVDIKNYEEIYKFLQSPKNLRPEIRKLEFDFIYNFDEQLVDLNSIKINNQLNEKVNIFLKKIVLKKNILQNKIYFKNIIKEFVSSYAG